jgi:hypothetical protein
MVYLRFKLSRICMYTLGKLKKRVTILRIWEQIRTNGLPGVEYYPLITFISDLPKSYPDVFRSNQTRHVSRVPAVMSQQSHFSEGRSATSLLSTREHFRPDPGAQQPVQELRGSSSSVHDSWSWSRLVGVLEPSQSSRLVGSGRTIGPVGPRGIQVQLPVNCWCRLLKRLFQVIVICFGCKRSE